MQPVRQLRLLPACQALTEDCGGDQFDSLIKDFHSAFVDTTQAVRRRHGSRNVV